MPCPVIAARHEAHDRAERRILDSYFRTHGFIRYQPVSDSLDAGATARGAEMSDAAEVAVESERAFDGNIRGTNLGWGIGDGKRRRLGKCEPVSIDGRYFAGEPSKLVNRRISGVRSCGGSEEASCQLHEVAGIGAVVAYDLALNQQIVVERGRVHGGSEIFGSCD